jgi:hypothetical protein
MALPALYVVTTFLLPETPFYLLKKDKLKVKTFPPSLRKVLYRKVLN